MPNWAWGTVTITGKKDNVHKFAQRFLYEGDEKKKLDPDVPYFARSFAQTSRSAVIDEINECFVNIPLESEAAFTVTVFFAYSADYCLNDGYPQITPESCITLRDACIADCVSVKITAEEPSSDIEEEIYCNKDGGLDVQSRSLPSIVCGNCNADNSVPSFADASEYECHECGKPLSA